jgi:hypothetical protein
MRVANFSKSGLDVFLMPSKDILGISAYGKGISRACRGIELEISPNNQLEWTDAAW